jgi:predicted O-methyltransferase YrrM
VLRKHFYPQFIKDTTENAYYNYFVKQDIWFDLIHIDADHTFEGVKKDFELYSEKLMPGGIITIHDTDKSYIENHTEIDGQEWEDTSGPSKFIETIDKDKFEVINFFNHGIRKDFPSSTGLTIVRKK